MRKIKVLVPFLVFFALALLLWYLLALTCEDVSSNISKCIFKTSIRENVNWWEQSPYNETSREIQWPELADPLPEPEIRHSFKMTKNVQMLTDDIAEFFKAKMKSLTSCQFAGKCPIRGVIFSVTSFSRSYGGTADRLRGLASTFYAALASSRVFKVQWEVPANLADLFGGDVFDYPGDYAQLLRNQSKLLRQQNYLGLQEIEFFFSSKVNVVRLSSNTPQCLRKIYNDQKLRSGLRQIILRCQYYGIKFSYELAIFIALRVLFGQPKQILSTAVDSMWQPLKSEQFDGCRIGVQLRMATAQLYERYRDFPRVNLRQIKNCFLPKVDQLASDCRQHKQTPIVYIASDSISAKHFLKEALTSNNITSLLTEFQAVHVDDNKLSIKSTRDRQQFLVETFAEWFILGQMNQLVISRSGYAELASTFGSFLATRRPTIRLPHGYNESCNFEDDYYIKSADLDDYRPPPPN